MARRLLTRTELRMEDLQEYEFVKKHQERRKNGMDSSNTSAFARPEESMISSFKHNREMIYERIGYNPTPRNPQWLNQLTCYYTSSLYFITFIT